MCAASVALSGCSTHLDLLELRRDQLLRLEESAKAVNVKAAAGEFDPSRYDLYLLLNRSIFEQTLGGISGTKVRVDAGGRDVEFTLTSVSMDFRPGAPVVSLNAMARDIKSGLEVEVYMDVRLVLEGDTAKPDELYLRFVATKLVPRIAWGPLDFTRSAFARDLLALEGGRFTERLPRMTLPLQNRFDVGAEGGTRPSGRLPTGNGSWIAGDVTYPGLRLSGSVAVKQVLFLGNGVHLFANVEGV